MATVPEFISILRRIRDVIYPEVKTLYDDSLILKESIDVGKAEFDADLIQFNNDYSDFNIKKAQVDASVTSASNSALSASQSAQTATDKSNEIKAITAQSTTGAPGTLASASYNPTDGKFTFVIPQGSKGDKGESFTVNSSGITAQRTLYDTQIAGWSFLDITTSTLYFKVSNTSGDWSTGVPFGKGDKGDKGDTGVGIVSFTFVSTTDASGLQSKSGATDTYRVTLTDSNTFDYQIYNGLDFNIHSYVEKTTLNNEDELGLSDSLSSFGLKKITWSNFKTMIISSFGTLIGTLTSKTTPIDTDELIIKDSADSNSSKKLTWANLKATLVAYLGTGSGFAISFGANSYIQLPTWLGGWKMQVGTATISASTNVVVTLPSAYATGQVFNIAGNRSGGVSTFHTATDTGSASQFTIYASSAVTATVTWLSIGH